MIITFNDLKKIREENKNATIALGLGTFDLIHVGHVAYFQKLKTLGDIVVVMVKSDERVRIGKGDTRPIITDKDRVKMVDSIKGVDYAFISYDDSITPVIENLQPDILYSTNPFWKKFEVKGKLKVIVEDRLEASELNSTTAIIKTILDKNHKDES